MGRLRRLRRMNIKFDATVALMVIKANRLINIYIERFLTTSSKYRVVNYSLGTDDERMNTSTKRSVRAAVCLHLRVISMKLNHQKGI